MQKSVLYLAIVAIVIFVGIKVALDTGEPSRVFAGGSVAIDPGLKDQAGQGFRTLFVVLYDQDSPMPMPMGAVKYRLAANEPIDFPREFILTKESMMQMGDAGAERPPPRTLRLKARLDRDGMGGSDQPGDITGEIRDVPVGSREVTITLNQVIN